MFPLNMRRKLLIVSLIYLGIVVVLSQDVEVSCKDEHGLNVDWFYLYKLPKYYKSDSLKSDVSGLDYLYITSRYHEKWTLSHRLINDSNSMPALTLEPLFDNAAVLLVGYNDEFPNGTFFESNGHTKGIVASDDSTAIWLIHSVPKFPSIPGYEYPKSGTHYGQSFLCLTLDSHQVHNVGEQLIFNEPNIYYSRLPEAMLGKYPSLEAVLQKRWRTTPPYKSVLDLKTLAGKQFRSFAKSSKYGGDLYADLLAPSLDVNLLVETWRNGAGNMASNCSTSDKVYNIASLQDKKLQLSFKTTTDHSKWAVSQATGLKLWRWRIGSAEDWICVGDINRQSHQLVRGGGTVCQKNSQVTELYRDLVRNFDPCN